MWLLREKLYSARHPAYRVGDWPQAVLIRLELVCVVSPSSCLRAVSLKVHIYSSLDDNATARPLCLWYYSY